MPKRIQKSGKMPFDKKIVACQTPALLAALSLLSTSLGVTTDAAEDLGARPNAGEKTAEATMTHMKDATITHRKAGKGQQEFLVAPSQQNKQQLQINQQNSPLQKGTLGGSTGPTKPPLPTTGGRRQ
jgi:hypothetical protein